MVGTVVPLVEVRRSDRRVEDLQRRRLPSGKSLDLMLVDSELRASVLVGWVRRTSDRSRDIPSVSTKFSLPPRLPRIG